MLAALTQNTLQDDHRTFLEELIEKGSLAFTCEVDDLVLTSTHGVRVSLVGLLADDFAWSVLTNAEVWSMSSRLQWLFVVGLDRASLTPEFFCRLYQITRG